MKKLEGFLPLSTTTTLSPVERGLTEGSSLTTFEDGTEIRTTISSSRAKRCPGCGGRDHGPQVIELKVESFVRGPSADRLLAEKQAKEVEREQEWQAVADRLGMSIEEAKSTPPALLEMALALKSGFDSSLEREDEDLVDDNAEAQGFGADLQESLRSRGLNVEVIVLDAPQ